MDKIDITDQLRNCHRLTKFELEQLCHEALNEIRSLRAEIDKLNLEMNEQAYLRSVELGRKWNHRGD